jgi:hypothetical protein
MTLFEFLMVIAGVVVAIAMTEIVSGWGRMIRASANVEFDWLHLGWSLTVLFNAMIYWLGIWPYSEVQFRYVAQTWFLVIPTLFLVLVAYALMPDIHQIRGRSLRDYFIANRRNFFASYILYQVFAQLADLVIGGRFIASDASALAALALFLGIAACLAVTRNLWAHRIGLVLYLLLILAYGPVPLGEISEAYKAGG